MHSENSRFTHFFVNISNHKFFCFCLLLFLGRVAFAEQMPVIISGFESQHGQLGAVGSIVKTIQHVTLNWIAPLFGTGLAVYGIYKIALRETMIGTIALLCGGAMFFVKDILEGLRAMTGAG